MGDQPDIPCTPTKPVNSEVGHLRAPPLCCRDMSKCVQGLDHLCRWSKTLGERTLPQGDTKSLLLTPQVCGYEGVLTGRGNFCTICRNRRFLNVASEFCGEPSIESTAHTLHFESSWPHIVSASTNFCSTDHYRATLQIMAHGGYFEEWQEKMRRAALPQDVVINISGNSQHMSLYLDSQPSGYSDTPDLYTSNAEHLQLINEPPPNFRVGNRSFSAPAHTEPIPHSDDAPHVASKKKRAARKPAAKKAKRDAASDDMLTDEEGEVVGSRWAESKVIQLIAFREEMDEEFEKNSKKQGVSTWDKLQAKMVVACNNFQKSTDACQKKWKYVYRQYANDKRILQVSGEGRKITCKFFEEIDQGFNNRANVQKMTHGDARGTQNPCPPDLNGSLDEVQGFAEAASALGKENKTPNKKSNGDIVTSLFSDMASAIVKISSDIHEGTEVFKGLRLDLKCIIEKL